MSLVQNNAEVGGKIAVELAKLKQEKMELANKKFSLGNGECGNKNRRSN